MQDWYLGLWLQEYCEKIETNDEIKPEEEQNGGIRKKRSTPSQ